MKLGRALLVVACAASCQEKQAPSTQAASPAPATVAAPAGARAGAASARAGSDGCDRIALHLHLVAARALPPVLDPTSLRRLGHAMTEVRASCREDGWSDALKQCALALRDVSDAHAVCRDHVSPELYAKLAARVAKVMAE